MFGVIPSIFLYCIPSSELLSSAMESSEGAEILLQPHRPRIFFRHFFMLICCFIFLQFHPCLSGNTISAGHSVTGNQRITSKGGFFELGYFSRGNPSRYYIGIWYKDVTNDNVVWVANRDTPLQSNTAELKISDDGSNLVIQTTSGPPIWSTNLAPITPSSHPARVALLNNNGNLVLKDGNSSGNSMWESFDHPTDTFLPGGRLGVNNVTKQYIAITSWKSKDDPSSGLYSQKINPDGHRELPLYWNNSHAYWTTGVWNGQYFPMIPDMIKIPDLYNNSFIVNENMSYYTYWVHESSMPTRTKIDVNGQIKQETWSNDTGSWTVLWAAPKDQCHVYALCGAFGVCNNQSNPKFCECVDGFEPASALEWESNAWSGGCIRNTKLQCEGDQFTKRSIESSPNNSSSNATSATVESCELACLNECSCTAYSYQNGACSAWKGDVLNLVQGSSDGGARSIFVRVANSTKSGGGKKHSQPVIIAVTVTSLLIILAAAGACYFWKAKAGKAGARKQGDATTRILLGEARNKERGGLDLTFYRLRDIMAATDNLSESNKLGQGGFGTVYMGILRGGQEVAIKRLSRSSKQGLEEFMNELMLIAKLQHANLVQLVGCCAEEEERILIYEYMPNKSLDHFLFDPILSKQLDWEKRFEIVMGIARGLQYLHQESRLKVIHRDLKTSNVLLDHAMNPRISDFGLARIFCDERSHISTIKVAGTCGYMPPEYALEGRYSTKSDVFSFGVIVLEIVSGLRMTSFRNEQHSLNLLGHAWKLWEEGKVPELLDHSVGTPHKLEEVSRCVNVGLLCVQEDAVDRPTMSSVITMLSSDYANLASPTQPAYSRKARSPDGGSTPVELELGNSSTNGITISAVRPR